MALTGKILMYYIRCKIEKSRRSLGKILGCCAVLSSVVGDEIEDWWLQRCMHLVNSGLHIHQLYIIHN
jgi:hypothetical protein